MVPAIRQQVTVQPGGVIEIRSPELTPGSSAEVIVLLDAAVPPTEARPLVSFIGVGRRHGRGVEEIDAHIRELRTRRSDVSVMNPTTFRQRTQHLAYAPQVDPINPNAVVPKRRSHCSMVRVLYEATRMILVF